MHALVRAILLRHAAVDPLGPNAEANPPHRQGGEPTEGARRAKGAAIVGANHTQEQVAKQRRNCARPRAHSRYSVTR